MNPQKILFGTGIPLGDLHAISVFIGTFKEAVKHEQGDPETLAALERGYPRNRSAKVLEDLRQSYEQEFASEGEFLQILPSETIAQQALDFVDRGEIRSLDNGITAIIIPQDKQEILKFFTENTGQILSSRLAEDVTNNNVVDNAGHYKETLDLIKSRIAGFTNADCLIKPHVKTDDIFLYLTGMASIYNAHQMITQQGKGKGKRTIQFGASYASSRRIQDKFNGAASATYVPYDSEADFEKFEVELIKGDVSAVFCEAPSNPLLRTIDLPRLKALTIQYDVPLVIDNTIGTWLDVDVTPYADIIVTSLSKSFTGDGNVMGGALTLNPLSKYYNKYHEYLSEHHKDHLYIRDALEIEEQSRNFKERVGIMNALALEVVALLLASPFVKTVNHPSVIDTDAYEKIRKPEGGYGSLFSFVMKRPEDAAAFYDALNCYKGPSFGMKWLLVYLYGIFANPNKRDPTVLDPEIDPICIDPYLTRVSVGCEGWDPVQGFRKALATLGPLPAASSHQHPSI